MFPIFRENIFSETIFFYFVTENKFLFLIKVSSIRLLYSRFKMSVRAPTLYI